MRLEDGAGFDVITDFSSNTLDEDGFLLSDRLEIVAKAGNDDSFDLSDFSVSSFTDSDLKGVLISFVHGGGNVLLKGVKIQDLAFTAAGDMGIFSIEKNVDNFVLDA